MPSLGSRLEARVRHLSHTIGERHFLRPEALLAAAHYIEEQLGSMGASVRKHEFFVNNQGFVNLEVLVPRADSSRQKPGCIVVGAHYDTVAGTPGADDNASGVAALLELVQQLGRERLDRTLRFVFFPNEEPPFFPNAGMGSAAYARMLRSEHVDVHVMISLEMLGYYSDRANSQKYPPVLSLIYPNRGNFIGLISNLTSRKRLHEVKRAFLASTEFPCESLAAPEWTVVVGLSDHRSFWSQGYQALMVTDTAFMRNPHYHGSSDTAETLDYGRFAEVTQGLVSAVKRLGASNAVANLTGQ
jgi:Zn-dependent M28 family amino/carboxypeptidase